MAPPDRRGHGVAMEAQFSFIVVATHRDWEEPVVATFANEPSDADIRRAIDVNVFNDDFDIGGWIRDSRPDGLTIYSREGGE